MNDFLFWAYLINSVLLIDHEIDSAYWREWRLFRLPGGITAFLLMHVPLLGLILYGLVEVYDRSTTGLVISSVMSGSGLFAFAVHMAYIRAGRTEFRTRTSILLLAAILIASVMQAIATADAFLD